jgi:16S rRNA (uracil1498-N3)-methyltransferase
MRTPRLYVSDCRHIQGEVGVSERNHHYLARVLRASVGQRLTLFDGQGYEAEAAITAISKKQTRISLSHGTQTEDVRLPITLGLAWIKSDRFDWAIQKATELGVSVIQPLVTAFSDSPPKGERLVKKTAHWSEVLIGACEQSGNNWMPELRPLCTLEQIDITIPTYVAHPGTPETAFTTGGHYQLLIGPEGGFSDNEVDGLRQRQVKPMSLGPTILRAETAAIVGLTILGSRLEHY